jgi:(4S)-4-hydroxy-5-phosphonooxypentane-2,3-dione isomerase
MTATCVHIHVIPESVEEFIRLTTANHLESVKEPGNLRFDLLQQPDDEQAAAHKIPLITCHGGML